ncbi:hypothetical protein SLA2020_047350 [Shorea laevis]
MGLWKEGRWEWQWRWRRNLFVWEHSLLQEMVVEIEQVKIKHDMQDSWFWKHDKRGVYTIKSAYRYLNASFQHRMAFDFKLMWNKQVPLKVSAFAWKATQDCLPTKANLARRGLLPMGQDSKCIFCGQHEDNADYLLFSCNESRKVWALCYSWWGIEVAANGNCNGHLLQHIGLISKGMLSNVWPVIWFAMVWPLWLRQNQRIFKKEDSSNGEVLNLIKYRTLSWIKARSRIDLTKELWHNNPREASLKLAFVFKFGIG